MTAIQSATEHCIGLAMGRLPTAGRPEDRPRATPEQRRWAGFPWGMPRTQSAARSSDSEDAVTNFSLRLPGQRTRTNGVPQQPLTAAQQVAARYWAVEAEREARRGNAAGPSSHVDHAGRVSADSPSPVSVEAVRIEDTMGARVRFRQSRADAMEIHGPQAYLMMAQSGSGERNVPCQVPGCGDVLPDLTALASHLHIHNLDPADQYALSTLTRPTILIVFSGMFSPLSPGTGILALHARCGPVTRPPCGVCGRRTLLAVIVSCLSLTSEVMLIRNMSGGCYDALGELFCVR
ncbi:hypothetical protein B0H21DRAFT_750344 [Amylocystis lapponica]|nr:hypothetical protein B0H21DRAFT_750344 [Amylocystis lapponica]